MFKLTAKHISDKYMNLAHAVKKISFYLTGSGKCPVQGNNGVGMERQA
jgi:ABC-type Na+ transport system ATPase subunit NatA